MNSLLPCPSLSGLHPPGDAGSLHLWSAADVVKPLAGRKDGSDFSTMMREVDRQMDQGFPLGLAFVVGDMDSSIRRRIRRLAGDQTDFLAWVATGPVLIAVFRKRLFPDLLLAWRQILADNADISTGVVFSDSLKDHTELVLAARIALHRAMAQSRDILVLDTAETLKAVCDHRIAVTMKKHLAAGGGDFEAFFQPQVDIRSGSPTGAEALARWHPDNVDIPPSRFIPIAEEAGLIADIGQMMFARSARTIQVLRRCGIEIPHIAVNVSPLQSRHGDLLRMVLDILHAEKLSPRDIEIEITESLAGSSGDDFLRWLTELSSAGFQIAIDDFGTGTSTLARLRNIPASKIKLDRAFVTPLPSDEAACAVCRTALDMVHSLGKQSLAEGIETPAQAAYLASIGCSQGQGFLWGRPMAQKDLIVWWGSDAGTRTRRPGSAEACNKGDEFVNRKQYLSDLARQNYVFDASLSEAELIRTIQIAEGNVDCYASAGAGACNEAGCRWREDCVAESTRNGMTDASLAALACRAQMQRLQSPE